MHRRDVIRLLVSSAALSAVPAEVMIALRQAGAESVTTGLRTLNRHQDATVVTLTELIIPQTDTPGAKATKVNEFIDLLLTEWYDSSDTERFLHGLAEVDITSRDRFKKDFLDCSPDQQTQLMRQWDDEAMNYARSLKLPDRHRNVSTDPASAKSAAPPSARHAMPDGTASAPRPENFFYTLKTLTLVGYYTSEAGFAKELGNSIIPAAHDGCAPLVESKA
jgi:hypothetical protein